MRLKNRTYGLLAALMLVTVCAVCSCASAPREAVAKPYRDVSLEEFVDILEKNPDIQLLDVRQANQFEAIWLKGSKGIPVEALQSRISEVDVSKPLVVYCRTNNRKAEAIKILTPKNPVEMIGLDGGMDAVLRFLTNEKQTLEASPEKKRYYDALRKRLDSSVAMIGLTIPKTSLTDGGGKVVSMTDFIGKPAVFGFFYASEAGQYEMAMSARDIFAKNVAGAVFVPVAVTDDEKSAKALAAKHVAGGSGKSMYFDVGARTAAKVGMSSLPYYMITDAEGVLRVDGATSAIGALDIYQGASLEDLAKTVVAGGIPPFPVSAAEMAAKRQDKLVGSPAPDFTLPDIKGERVGVRAYRGDGAALLIFGTLGCPYTVKHLIAANACGKRPEQPGGFKTIAILPGSNFQDAEQAKNFVTQNNITFPVLMDSTGESFSAYAISSVPVWWVVGADGKIKFKQVGFSDSVCAQVAQALGK